MTMRDGGGKRAMANDGGEVPRGGDKQLRFGRRSQAGEDPSTEANVMAVENLPWLSGLGEFLLERTPHRHIKKKCPISVCVDMLLIKRYLKRNIVSMLRVISLYKFKSCVLVLGSNSELDPLNQREVAHSKPIEVI